VAFRKGLVPLEKGVSVLARRPLCGRGLSAESPCRGINRGSLGDSNLSLLFIFTRSQATQRSI